MLGPVAPPAAPSQPNVLEHRMSRPDDHELTVAYVIGSGRSGSTLLDMMLGAHPAAVSLGQADSLRVLVERGEPCTCGEAFEQCPVWCDAVAGHRAPPGIDEGRDVHKTLTALLALVRRGEAGGSVADADRWWNEMALVAGRADARVVVDSSKTVIRALRLDGGGDVRWLHLVRDPRAQVHSRRRAGARQDSADPGEGRLSLVVSWVLQNGLAHLHGLRRGPDHYFVLTYERLVTEPERVSRALARFLGLDPEPSLLPPFDPARYHLVGGNRARFGISELRLDDAWRHEMPARDRRIVSLAAGWLRALLERRARRDLGRLAS